ncbi:hypothetical protein [Geomonas ferrireducens]|uniref:hypothetical protein n=1 Tax=Geomonas ferrireducens TaxID=2570227 RepID=UPI0010A8EF89|nr:hypothetical protein [Geomonas ferrireducens]
MRLPSDLEILRHIYDTYLEGFRSFDPENATRGSRTYVPIDIRQIATDLETDPYILFGRLYYHLDHKYRYTQEDGSLVFLFLFSAGEDIQARHSIHFPYLASVVSEKTVEDTRSKTAIVLSLLSLGVAIASLFIKR